MIKRPLVFVLGAYLSGMFFAWQKVSYQYILLLVIFVTLMIYFLLYRLKSKYINRLDRFLWCLPVLILFGFYAMNAQLARPELDNEFKEKADCELTGEITMIVEKPWGRALHLKENTVSLSEGKPYRCENVIVYCSDSKNYLIGNQITVYGEIQKFSEATNPGQFNEKMYYMIENIDYKIRADEIIILDHSYSKYHDVLNQIKHKLMQVYEKLLPKKESGALIAMLLGEKYLLEEELQQLYQENGISHILAISGLHISLIGLFVYKILKKIKIPNEPSTILSILFIYSYGILTNFSISTNRSVVMMIIMLLSAIFGKTYDMLSSISLSALLILLKNPLQIFSAGFLLSFGAVLGIAVILPCIYKLFPSKNPVISSFYVSAIAGIITMPMVLYFFYQIPVYSILVNILVLPLTSALMLTAILAGVVGVIFLPAGIFLIGGADYILRFYEWVCKLGSNLPGNLVTLGKPDWLRILCYVFLLTAFVWSVKRYQKKYLILLLFLSILPFFLPQKNVGLEITVLDVGQGEAIFLKTGSGTTYLIDGGSSNINKVGTNRIQPFLLSIGVDTLDYAFISHSDNDHTSGLEELMTGDKIKIKNLILPKTSLRDENYHKLEALAKDRDIKVSFITRGDTILDGDIKMTCLHPSPDFPAQTSNSYSTVLSVSFKEFDMLFTGDLEEEGEKLVTQFLKEQKTASEFHVAADYDILKVAHHGSKNSTFDEFLKLIRPEISLISCGRDNRYGHPHEELLERLDDIKSEVAITYERGAINIKTDGKRTVVEEYTE